MGHRRYGGGLLVHLRREILHKSFQFGKLCFELADICGQSIRWFRLKIIFLMQFRKFGGQCFNVFAEDGVFKGKKLSFFRSVAFRFGRSCLRLLWRFSRIFFNCSFAHFSALSCGLEIQYHHPVKSVNIRTFAVTSGSFYIFRWGMICCSQSSHSGGENFQT